MPRYVGLTGTPGTGKKSLAPFVAAALGLQSFGLNDLAVAYGLAARGTDGAEVNAQLLGKAILRHVKGPALLYGHLLPYAFAAGTFQSIVVLRCEPKVLKRRLIGRGYAPEKVVLNLEAELIGAVASDTIASFGEKVVAEFDTSKGELRAAGNTISSLITEELGGRGKRRYDWTRGYDSARKLRSLLSVPDLGLARI